MSMIAGFKASWRALRHLNHRGYVYVWANLFWLLLTLPIITAPAAWAGLMVMSHRAHTSPTGDLHDFWDGFRQNLARGFLLALANVVIIGVNVVNLLAYAHSSGIEFVLLRTAWLFTLAIWLTVQFYMWALYYEMKEPTLLGAMRNALVLMLLNPGFTLSIWIVIGALLAFSTLFVVLWLLLTGSALAVLATSAVQDRLETGGFRQRRDLESEVE